MRLCGEIAHNANSEVSGSKNQLVPIVDKQAVKFLVVCRWSRHINKVLL